MPKQVHCDTATSSMNKSSVFNLPHKKWNVLRTGVMWAQRLKSVKSTKGDSDYAQLNNNDGHASQTNKEYCTSGIFTSQNCTDEVNDNSDNKNNINSTGHSPKRTVSNITKLNEKDYDYIDRLQKRGVIKHSSSTKQLKRSFPSSTSVNTLIGKTNSFAVASDVPKSPMLCPFKLQSLLYESNKDSKEVRFICATNNGLDENSQINNSDNCSNIDTTYNQQVVNVISRKSSCQTDSTSKDQYAHDSSEKPVFSGAWPINPYSPLPSPDIYPLDIEYNENHFSLDTQITSCNKHLQRHESWQSLELDTVPSSSGTGESDPMPTKPVSTSEQTTGSATCTNQGGQYNEQIDLASRRGRRSAIIDNKNLIGESEVENQDTVNTSQNPNKTINEGGQERPPIVSSVNSFRERQRKMLRKQNTIADLSSRNQLASPSQDYELKRRANVFLKLIERGTRSKESLLDLNEALQSLKSSYFHDQYLESFRDSHWSHLDKSGASEDHMPDREVRRREAVWELFKSELTFFIDHLMVLKNCFMEPLKKLQVDGYLMFVEPMHLFGNLDDLCYVSHTFCRELISNLSQESVTNEFGSTDVLLRPLKRWSEHSRDGEIYHNYCLNYDSALTYLDSLRKFEHFNEFEKWCEQDTRCRRLQLTDLLVAPMQHYMKIPLMLSSIRRYTACSAEQEMLTACLTKVENSLKSLEDKMRWLKNFERLQEIQSQLIWPSVSELEPRVFIPEFLRQSLARQPCERLIANPKRQLLHEGFLTLNDGTKTIEIFAFLFDDFLLITRIKKPPKKKSFSENPLAGRSITEGGVFVVYRQVIALDRFTIHDLGIVEATANGLRNAIVLVLITRFQQITGVYTLQAANELDKQRWIEKLRNSQQAFQEKLKHKLYGIDVDQHTNKHSKLINQKHKLTSQTSLAEESLTASLQCDIIGTEKKLQDLSDVSESDRHADINNPIRSESRSDSSLRKLTESMTNESQSVNQQKQSEKQLQLCGNLDEATTNLDDTKPSSYHEINNALTNSEIVVEISDKDNPENQIEDNSYRNTDSPFDECELTITTTVPFSDVLLPHSKTPEYIMRNRHSLDPNITKLSIPEQSNATTTTTVSTKDPPSIDLPTTPTMEKQIVTPIFSPPSLLLFDRLSHQTEFPYEMTRQTQFSPPLSPILHAPCASLPMEVTAQNLYDLPDRMFSKLHITGNPPNTNAELHGKRSLKGLSISPPLNRKN